MGADYKRVKLEVYSFNKNIEDNKKFTEDIKESGVQHQNNDIIPSILKANKIDKII